MTTLPKSASLNTLGLPAGDHVLRLHVAEDEISFEIESSFPDAQSVPSHKPSGFLQRWGGRVKREDDPTDAWLTHINEKHLR